MNAVAKTKSGVASSPNSTVDSGRYEMARLLAFAFCSADALLEIEPDGRIVYASGATQLLFGHKPSELPDQMLDTLPAKEDRAMLGALLQRVADGKRFQSIPIKISRAEQADIVVSLSGYCVPDLSNHYFMTGRMIETGRDVANGGDRNADTGLLTADGFGESVKKHVAEVAGTDDQGELTFVGLSGMSDLKGRLDEDEHKGLLRRLGTFMQAVSLGGETAAQLGNNRFGLLHSPDMDLASIEGQISQFSRDADPKGVGVSVTTQTVGVETMDLTGQDVAQALVYTIQQVARTDDGDITKLFSSNLNEQLNDAASKIAQVKSVIESGQFDVAFQAIVSLASRKAHHFEALIRLTDSPVKMNPFDFVCFAEEVGLILDFDLAMCRKVINRVTSASERGAIVPIAVNISGRSIGSDAFVENLRALLAENPQVHGLLLFEITETARINDLHKANEAIRSLRADGFHVCLDDFGSGEAAFEYLRELEVDFVKIDGKYVVDAEKSPKDKAFLIAMSGLCRDLGIATIAEFVETEETLAFLKECGVAYGQGYLFHKPDVSADLSGDIGAKKNIKRKGSTESWG